MNLFRQHGYFLSQGWTQFVRDGRLSGTAVFASVATFFVSGLFLLVAWNLATALMSLRDQREVQVFLEAELTADRWAEIGAELDARPEIASAHLVTPDDALAEFEADFGESGLVDALGTNPLPASYRLTLTPGRGPETIAILCAELRDIPGVDDVVYGAPGLVEVEARVRRFAWLAFATGLAVGLSTILIVANTIRLTVIAREELVEILKLIGATDGFVRWPFVWEGVFQTLVASSIAIVALWLAARVAASNVAAIVFFELPIAGAFLVFAAITGLIGAWWATSHPLRDHRKRA